MSFVWDSVLFLVNVLLKTYCRHLSILVPRDFFVPVVFKFTHSKRENWEAEGMDERRQGLEKRKS